MCKTTENFGDGPRLDVDRSSTIEARPAPARYTRRVLLGIDLGELPDEPLALFRAADVAYIAGGGHAGDEASIDLAVRRCAAEGTRVGAHPSFPDRARFGRVELDISKADLAASIFEQCARVARAAAHQGQRVEYLKLHGALYHCADRDEAVAVAALDATLSALGPAVTVVAWPDRATGRAARARGLSVLREGFADRAVREDQSLVPRGQPGAVLTSPPDALARVRALIDSNAIDVLCVHGDNSNAAEIALAVRSLLDERRAGSAR